MVCEMCGSEGNLYRTTIEGTEMSVCSECSKFGEILGPIREEVKIEKKKSKKIEVE